MCMKIFAKIKICLIYGSIHKIRFYDATIKKIIGKMKDGTKGIPIIKFAVFKSNMCSLMKNGNKGNTKTKAINEDIVKK